MTQEILAVGSLPTPTFLRLPYDDHVSYNKLTLNHPPAPGQCITTLQPESADVSDSNLALNHPPAPCQCITTLQPEMIDPALSVDPADIDGKNEPSVQFDDLDLNAPPPGFHTQSCACGLGCVAPVAQKSDT